MASTQRIAKPKWERLFNFRMKTQIPGAKFTNMKINEYARPEALATLKASYNVHRQVAAIDNTDCGQQIKLSYIEMTYKRKKNHHGDTHDRHRWKTRNRKKDLDEISEDIKPENIGKLLNQEVDEDKPGCGQFYCVHCARYFIDNSALKEHFRTKVHKRRLKNLETEPYTIEDSERASGKGSYIEPKKRKIETQAPNEMQITQS